jgi:hypothetical protein
MTTVDISSPKKRNAKWWWIAVALAAGLVSLAMCSDDDLHLKLTGTALGLQIINQDSTPVQIIDLVINGREDCSTYEIGRSTLSKEYLHKAWVANGALLLSLEEKDGKLYNGTSALSTQPTTLRSGDVKFWVPPCNVELVSATVKTDRGSATYTFR